MANVCVIGGGIAGSTAALKISSIGLNVDLFEKESTLVSGPPFCHLHAGGNLYREIPYSECKTLLRQSIDLAKYYPYAIDFRPTIITVPKIDDGDPLALKDRLTKLQNDYQSLIDKDESNKVLGEPSEYFKIVSKDQLLTSTNRWLKTFKENVNLEQIKFPIIMVQEYGINLFRISAGATLSLNNTPNCNLHMNSEVIDISKINNRYKVKYFKDGIYTTKEFDYIVNAAGFRSGTIDDMLNFKQDRFVEFKAAYVTKWEKSSNDWPEIIFHGKRGTPNGMGQFTPYPNGHFQLHGMTKHITLFKDGLVQSSKDSSQPQLHKEFLEKIEKNWEATEVEERTTLAIEHLAQFIPSFSSATVASKPLFGAQQIPGKNEELRAADVSFEKDNYARCEVVKASSVLDMSDAIIKQLINLEYITKEMYNFKEYQNPDLINEEQIDKLSSNIAKQRNYPTSLAKRCEASL